MAEGPIYSRRAFADANDRVLEFTLVQTPLGQMVEPRPLLLDDAALIYRLEASVLHLRSYTSIVPLETDSMFPLYGTGGQQVPTDFTTP